MPTVHRFDGLRVAIDTDDHPPAHIHVIGAGREVIFDLNCPYGPPEVRRSRNLRPALANRIRAHLTRHIRRLCEEWIKLHGDY